MVEELAASGVRRQLAEALLLGGKKTLSLKVFVWKCEFNLALN